MNEHLNWAKNITYGAPRQHQPSSVEELQGLVRSSSKVKALGTRHSFNQSADTPGDQIEMTNLNRILGLDTEGRTVTIEGGVRYGELCTYLDRRGYALHNLASLPHISVAGACATATHGSGLKNGNLATSVRSVDIVQADGSLVTLRRGRDADFHGAVVGIGALGIVARMALDLLPSFQMGQRVFEHLPFEVLEGNLRSIMSSGYSVSLFTNWESPSADQVWVKYRPDAPVGDEDIFGCKAALHALHPIREIDPINCTSQMGELGPWYERMPHFRMDFTPSSGEELQSEFFVPFASGYDAIQAIVPLGAEIAPLLHICEIRSVAHDELWMSPSYKQDCLALHFTWKPSHIGGNCSR